MTAGLGDVESTQPTKTLMKLAEYIDTHSGGGGGGEGEGLKEWFLSSKAEVLDMLAQEVGRQEREKKKSSKWQGERWANGQTTLTLFVRVSGCFFLSLNYEDKIDVSRIDMHT